jgi:hypothetical protein
MNTVSNILREKNVKSKQIVKTCGVSQVTACSWIRGASVPHMKYIRDLATMSNTHYNRLVQARDNASALPRTASKTGTRPKWSPSRRGLKPKAATTNANKAATTSERRCHLVKVAAQFATLSDDEKTVVSMMADALALLEGGAS